MLAAAESAGRVSSSPCKVVLELLRATDTENSFAFMLEEQSYVRHIEGGSGRSASFPWSDEVLKRLAAVQRDKADPEAAAWLGEEMRSFLDRLGFRLDEEHIRRALDDGRPVHITLRLAAAELFALPWELVPLGATGRPLGSLPGCLLHYEWPDTRTAKPEPDPPREGGRILFAWSAAGGVVPADEHLAAIRHACRQGRHRGLGGSRDVLAHASLGRLQSALRAEPTAVLHLLCHGGSTDASGASYGLVLDSDGGASPEVVDARALQMALAEHLGSLRLVVLSACHSGNPGALDSRLGSLAQALHRAGIPAVVASRYPLPVDASIALTESLYEGLLVEDRALSGALLGARDRLRGRAGWASLSCTPATTGRSSGRSCAGPTGACSRSRRTTRATSSAGRPRWRRPWPGSRRSSRRGIPRGLAFSSAPARRARASRRWCWPGWCRRSGRAASRGPWRRCARTRRT
ncbi:uncharacterized protein SOCE26_066190 [Sorangium cellulosum]|uniref:CHAT domain-containing protein n=1 Tax=Sorangium cellulosum TaxID=56 RepID=A0A2L0F0P7_SORCE|nr:CHAT domain-containing protein [Sorangium cellulosum]AUX45138.1 uncharacterized protein SOCE26_066190 [Sorangium cellulosum]